MKKALKKKPKYALGVVYSGNEIVTVKKVYPPGHRYASKKGFGYLIHTTDMGEDEVLEYNLGRLIQSYST